MKNNSKAQIVTIAILVLLLGVALVRKTSWRLPDFRAFRISRQAGARAGQDPQDTIYTMLNAARAGDVKTYLAEFTGEMHASLRQSLAEAPESGFAEYL